MNTSKRPVLVCVTPVKNEAWILERFLRCASLWADHIIVADQNSDDGSREIACRFPKVTLIHNTSPQYDEGTRQALLLDAARRIPGRRIIIALDADEMLTANWSDSSEWGRLQQAAPGTVLTFQWVNVLPDAAHGWMQPEDLPLGFVDDESAHRGEAIHSTRVPAPAGAPRLCLKDVKVLHYQFTDWERMKSKQRWYQCWERLHHPAKRPVAVYRQYHHMDAIPPERRRLLQPEWTGGYARAGIDMAEVRREEVYQWDRDVARWLAEHGRDMFRRCDIWDINWAERCRIFGLTPAGPMADPRSALDRRIHQWLARTQGRALSRSVRARQRLLRVLGW